MKPLYFFNLCFMIILERKTVECAENASVRLVNGGSPCAGRVEVYHRGQWGTVGGYGKSYLYYTWNMKAAAVVCLELGCGAALSASMGSPFGSGSGVVVTCDVRCKGSESALRECPSWTWDHHRWSHSTDVGVICSGGNPPRLVNGSSHCVGRVELYTKESWGTVCGETLNMKIAGDICRYLGCGSAVSASGDARFGEGLGPVIGRPDCGHGKDGGIICSGGNPPRLVNGSSRCAGRVELHTKDTWGTLCGENLNMKIAEDICKYLGCGFAVSASGSARFGEGLGPVIGRPDCGHGQDGGVFCSGGKPPRLVNGSSRCVGRLELYTNDTWGTVCGETLDMKIAGDICTYLECGFAVSASGGGRFGEGSGPVVGRPDCGHREAGGIFCSDHLQKPNISMMSDAQVIVRGESAEISCSGNYPGSNFSLYSDGAFITSQPAPEHNKTAIFIVSEISAGNFWCKYTAHIDGREFTSPESERLGISVSGSLNTQGIANLARLILVIALSLVIIVLLVVQFRTIKKDSSQKRIIEETT